MRPLGFRGKLLVRGLPWYSPVVNQTYYIDGGLNTEGEHDVRVYLHYASRIQNWMPSARESGVRRGVAWWSQLRSAGWQLSQETALRSDRSAAQPPQWYCKYAYSGSYLPSLQEADRRSAFRPGRAAATLSLLGSQACSPSPPPPVRGSGSTK